MLTYLIQMIACSGVLYAYYHFFLRNEKFHQYNRFYLLFAMSLSLFLPLLKIPVIVKDTTANPVYAFVSTGETVVVTATTNDFDYAQALYIVYGCIVLWMALKLLRAVLQIARIKKTSITESFEEIQFIRTVHPDAPFSFFKWLFWNERTELESTEGIYMFKHEMYHIRSKHSLDLLFMEIIVSICWFNPFFYLYRKEVKTIQEFLADQHAAGNSNNASYAELLLMHAIGSRHRQLINPFFHNQLKRRITMLTSSKKPQYQWLRKLLVLPVATTAIALFAFTYEKEISSMVSDNLNVNTDRSAKLPVPATVVNSEATATIAKDTVPAKATKEITGRKPNEVSTDYITGNGRYRKLNTITVVGWTEEESPKKILKEGEIKVDVEAKFSGNWNNFLERNLDGQIPTQNGAPAGNYEVLVRFVVNEDGTVSNIEPITNEGYGMEEEVVRILKKSPEWYPAINNNNAEGKNKPVKSYRIQPINFYVMRKTAKADESSPRNIGIVTRPSSPGNSGKEPEVFTRVETDAAYPGNWNAFIARNLDRKVAVNNNAPKGSYTTAVQFIVSKEGNVTDVKTVGKKAGYGMDEEAVRVIKKSGKWKPAIQNGREVVAYRTELIKFEVSDQMPKINPQSP
ncbi:energy transducer TonB [Niabella sp. CJ426]|uniref:energy transducer TonB n=1 Tax=Niabella sp. CJ426 TaxID=3393740 RepID=UPI003D00B167